MDVNMKNDKSNVEKTIEKLVENAMTVADVARELNLDPKRARAFLRKNVELYVARHQRFTKTSSLYKKTFDALKTYRDARIVVTK